MNKLCLSLLCLFFLTNIFAQVEGPKVQHNTILGNNGFWNSSYNCFPISEDCTFEFAVVTRIAIKSSSLSVDRTTINLKNDVVNFDSCNDEIYLKVTYSPEIFEYVTQIVGPVNEFYNTGLTATATPYVNGIFLEPIEYTYFEAVTMVNGPSSEECQGSILNREFTFTLVSDLNGTAYDYCCQNNYDGGIFPSGLFADVWCLCSPICSQSFGGSFGIINDGNLIYNQYLDFCCDDCSPDTPNEETDTPKEERSRSNRDIQIYPNPFTNQINVSNIEEVKQISIFSVDGKLIRSYNPVNNIDLSELEMGFFFIKVLFEEESKCETYKILKIN